MEQESREQTVKKLEFYIPRLSDKELRLVAAFIRGMLKVRRAQA